MSAIRRIPWMKYASASNFYPLANRLVPLFMGLAIVLALMGLYVGFFVAPIDYQQGNSYRIMFIHVPAAWMSMLIYLLLAMYAIISLVWRVKMADIMAYSLAPTGAMFTFLALLTGALWGRPTWGTYWVWDARLTSELLLLFLYLGYMGLYSAIPDRQRASRAASFLAIVGVVNVPIIYFSVIWWNSLHQGSSFSGGPSMTGEMLSALLLMVFACWAYTIAVVLRRAQAVILERKKVALWASQISKK
ncbi:Cytochrome c-type biogenesis protein CcmC, putative heme lyase for CcmE [hydrothermal vent metagenome]|uniref:Cytochrome c-type biogenesis protein CcmC, putative heme lyase for CcmE n=1 Tax=hydrothermal vent metagenome TaxID=652676 RepID=A0A3B0WKJ9_9ZZZZ